jgi:hypothetical protein
MVDYNPNIPQATDNLSTSQGQILNNFGQLDTIFDIDHYKFDDNNTAARGMHRQIDFPATRSDPTLAGTAGMVYTKNISSVAELFFANSSATASIWRGGSGSGTVTSGPNIIQFPNGLIIQWAFAASVSSGSTITFPTAFVGTPGFVSAFAVNIIAALPTAAMVINGSVNNTSFSVRYLNSATGTTVTAPLYWLAIGF